MLTKIFYQLEGRYFTSFAIIALKVFLQRLALFNLLQDKIVLEGKDDDPPPPDDMNGGESGGGEEDSDEEDDEQKE